jgi:FkbM family methyltransferase
MASALRSLAERLTRPLTFRRRLPPPFQAVRIYVTPSSALSYAFKRMDAIDPALLRCAAQLVQPGNVVWDIGANVGLFAAAAAARAGTAGQVIAFEPDIMLARLLQRSNAIRPPSSASIDVVPAAIAGEAAIRAFQIAARGRASNALAGYGHAEMGGIAQRELVATFNMDWLLEQLPAPQVVKIDVEGAEVEALSGQKRMLDEVRPAFICEVSRRNSAAVSGIFAAANYRLYDAEQPLVPEAAIAKAAWNTVAIPAEKPLPPLR